MRVGLLYVDNFQQTRSQRIGSLGLGYIAAYLEQEIPGLETCIAVSPQELIAFEADLIGVSAYTETLPAARRQAAWLRQQRDVPLVLGGAHIATNPADLPPEFDFGVAGEGEELLLELVRLQLANALVPQQLKSLQGLTWRHQGEIRSQGRAPEIREMDKLAHPDRHKMFASMYRHFSGFEPVVHIHTARGCPYRCTFCSAPLVNPQWRFHSPEWVIAELEGIAAGFPAIREITLSDDLFTLKKSRLEALVRAIRDAGLHRRFAFFCSSRSNTLTHDMCRLLRDMNVVMVSFGLESAADEVIRELKGVGAHRGDYERVLGMCEHYGIYAHGNFIIGSQRESLADLQQTWSFVRDQQDRLASIYFSHMTPFPGTKVWDEGLAAGRFDPQTLDYTVLNLEYEPGHSVFLNTLYAEAEYARDYQRFKTLETWLDHRYYREQTLIADVTRQERDEIPAAVIALCRERGWRKLAVLGEGETWLTPQADLLWRQVEPDDPFCLEADALLLFYALDRRRDPLAWLERLPPKPLLSLNYHIGAYPIVSQLLLGQWQEAVYAATRRRHLRYFTLASLTKLLARTGYRLEHARPNRFGVELNYRPLEQLLGEVKDPDVFSYLSCWLPATPAVPS